MTEQLISLETFDLAREKGFTYNVLTEHTKRPTQSLLQKWLREKHNYFLVVKCNGKGKFDFHGYYISDHTIYNDIEIGAEPYRFNTYEEALETGLKEALKLIP